MKSQTLRKTDLTLFGGLGEVANNFVLDLSDQEESIKKMLNADISFILIARVKEFK